MRSPSAGPPTLAGLAGQAFPCGGLHPRDLIGAPRKAALAAALVVLLAFAPPGCKRRRPEPAASADEGAPELASTVHLGDPKVADQLVNGFYDIEAGTWRWTARKFLVVLRSPSGSGQLGAQLTVNLTVPPVVIEKLSSISLSASIGDTALAPETWTRPGDYVYRRTVPASAFHSPATRIEFQLDKAMPPGPVDKRELGIIVGSVGLALQ